MSVTRDDIVREAIELLKAEGLDALSLRKLAARLKITAPTLYWHVANKRELLDLMATELIRDQLLLVAPRPGQPWWEWLRERMRGVFETLIETRDAPRVLAGNRPSPDSLDHLESNLEILIKAGLPAGDAQQAMFSLGAYTMGSVIEWQAEADRARDGVGIDPRTETAIRGGEYPSITAAVQGIAGQPARATFEFGLDLLIDALRARYAAARPDEAQKLSGY